MSWIFFTLIGAACGWISALANGDKTIGGAVAAGAFGGLLLGILLSFVFGFLFFIVKVAIVIFGVLVLLALLGAGDSD